MKALELSVRKIDSIKQMYVLHDQNEIIISLLPPLAELNSHDHAAGQFGTSFINEFTFYIGEQGHHVTGDVIYDIAGGVSHSASSPHNDTIATLDIKYIGENENASRADATVVKLIREMIQPNLFRQTYENDVFKFQKYLFGDCTALECGKGEYDYVMTDAPGIRIIGDTETDLTEFCIYRFEKEKAYRIAGCQTNARLLCITFK